MTALADSLLTAQRQAITALERAYVAGQLDSESLAAALDSIGATDAIERAYLLAALDVLREWGAPPPQNSRESYSERRQTEPLTEPQRKAILRMCDERGVPAPDFAGITKPQASEIIQSLQDGGYDAEKWAVPF